MRKYLAALHQKPDHHKKRFALLASSTVTLFIFGVWSLATFGVSGGAADQAGVSKDSAKVGGEVSPLGSWRADLATGLEALKGNFRELKAGLETVNLKTEYQEMKDNALKVYGQ